LDGDRQLGQIHLAAAQRSALGSADAGAVKQGQHGAIPQADHGVGLGLGQQTADLLGREHHGQLARGGLDRWEPDALDPNPWATPLEPPSPAVQPRLRVRHRLRTDAPGAVLFDVRVQ
jgi:hypothetical protein